MTVSALLEYVGLDAGIWTLHTAWRRSESLVIADDDDNNNNNNNVHAGDVVTVCPRQVIGLLGGKGGFGAGLRAMGKGLSQAKAVADFSLCRDLQGRRLGAMNDAARSELQRQNPDAPIDSWVLERPSWAEPVTKRNKQASAPHASSSHHHNQKPASSSSSSSKRSDAFALDFARKIDATERSVVSAVMAGLNQSTRTRSVDASGTGEETATTSSSAEVDPPTTTTSKVLPPGIELLSGEADVIMTGPNTYLISGKSEFATVLFRNISTTCGGGPRHTAAVVDGVLTMEAKCITEGLVQMGMVTERILAPVATSAADGNDGASQVSSVISETSQDGVGDVAGSWSIDGVRGLLWLEGTPMKYGTEEATSSWSAGDLVGCKVEAQTGITFSYNKIQVSESAILPPFVVRVFGAVSLEFDQVVEVMVENRTVEVVVDSAITGSSSSSSSSSTTTPAQPATITIDDLVALGGDRLKQELSDLGLKKGGTVKDRASRLYLARTLPREDWPANLFP